MRKIISAILVTLFLTLGFGASASADPKPEFTVTTEGIVLNEGVTFGNNHNIHIDYYGPDGYEVKVRGNSLQGPEDGSFVSWAYLGVPDGSIITYVHVTGHGKIEGTWEFGKGVTPGPAPEPKTETKSDFETRFESEFICPTEEGQAYGEVFERENKYRIDYERTQVVTWNEDSLTWDVTWGEWEKSGEEFVETVSERTRLMTDEEAGDCGLAATGAPIVGAGIAALVLLGLGTVMVIRRRN